MFKIKPLTEKTLKEAVDLINMIFPGELEEPPKEELPASLTSGSDKKYWLAINEIGQVVGTVGLYCYSKDKNEAFWLGWFCVQPDYRRKGIGEKLLRFAISKAKKKGKKIIRLYTSTDPAELFARRLYEKYGFRLIGREPYCNNADIEKLYYELKL